MQVIQKIFQIKAEFFYQCKYNLNISYLLFLFADKIHNQHAIQVFNSTPNINHMRPFNFIAVKEILHNQKNQDSMHNRNKSESTAPFLQMFSDFQLDPKLAKHFNQIDGKFKEYSTNHRRFQVFSNNDPHIGYFSKIKNRPRLQPSSQNDRNIESRKDSSNNFRNAIGPSKKSQSLHKLHSVTQQNKWKINFQVFEKDKLINEFKVNLTKSLKKNNLIRNSAFLKNKLKRQKLPPKQLRRKFRHNIHLIINKLKKMNLTFDQVIKHKLFAKHDKPYKFGRAIFTAVKQNNEERVFRETIQNRLAIFSTDITGKTPLIWASIRGHHVILEKLLQVGSQIDRVDFLGNSSIHYSIKYGNSQCTRILALYLSDIKEEDFKQAEKGDRKIINLLNMWRGISGIMKSLNTEKRIEFFNDRYKYYYEEW